MKIKAAVLNTMGVEAPYAKSKPLSIEEVELDDPGHGEVLVKIGAAGLCHSDLSVIDGNHPRPIPMVLGHETAGIVEKLGSGVDDLKIGDHVVLYPTAGIACHVRRAVPRYANPALPRTVRAHCSLESADCIVTAVMCTIISAFRRLPNTRRSRAGRW
jgi:NADPH:quinone reductase-like Zn-dependent oxidoreductase